MKEHINILDLYIKMFLEGQVKRINTLEFGSFAQKTT